MKRFHSKYIVDSVTGCWNWNAAKYRNGYGVFHIDGHNHTAHRASWMIHKGEIDPVFTDVCHKCDNKACVNPEHLFLGTRQDNMMDRVRKGKHPRKPNKGMENGRSKLTDEIVRQIRADTRTHAAIARELMVSEYVVSRTRRGLLWKHVS